MVSGHRGGRNRSWSAPRPLTREARSMEASPPCFAKLRVMTGRALGPGREGRADVRELIADVLRRAPATDRGGAGRGRRAPTCDQRKVRPQPERPAQGPRWTGHRAYLGPAARPRLAMPRRLFTSPGRPLDGLSGLPRRPHGCPCSRSRSARRTPSGVRTSARKEQ